MTFPTTPILDNFNRANEGPPITGWHTPTYGVMPYSGGMRILSNLMTTYESNNVGVAVWNAGVVGPNCEIYITVINTEVTLSDLYLFWRRDDKDSTTPTGYFLHVGFGNGITDDGFFELWRNDAGSNVLLDHSAFDTAIGSSVGASMIGSAIKTYYKAPAGVWIEKQSITDTTYSSAGWIGVSGNSLIGGQVIELDDFGGGSISNDDSGGQPGDDDPGGSAPGPVASGPAYLINAHHIDASGAGAIGLRVADVAYVMNSRVTGDVGVQVEDGGILRPFGLQYPSKTLVGTGAIKPLFGDRAAWDTTLYAGRHAHDISEGTYLYHTDPTNPPVTQLAPITTVSAPTALDATHYIVIVSNGSTITLPTAASIAGKQYNIIRSGTSNVLINTTGGQTISGDASLTLTAQWDSVVVVSNGSNWIRCS